MNGEIDKKKRDFDKKENTLDERKRFIDKISVFVLLIFTFGYIVNIIKILSIGFNDMNAMMILRVIGFFIPPIGAILGYF